MKMSASMRLAGLWLLLFAGIGAAQTQTPPPALFIVNFETGPSWDKSRPPAEQPGFREHSANLNRLRKESRIVFGARYAEIGMIFLKADSLQAATAAIDADPGVRAGIFIYRIAPLNVFYPWQP
jgi:uncharacterized protein YciI